MLSGRPLRRRSRWRRRLALALAEADLLLEQLPGHADVAADEDGERQLDGVEDLAVEGVDVARALFGEAQPVPDLLGGELDQVLVDDVADMLEVGGEGDDLHRPAAFRLAHVLLADLGQVQLDRLVQPVDDVVVLARPGRRDCDRPSRTPSACRAASARACRPCAGSRAPPQRSPAAACRAPSRPDSAASTARRRRCRSGRMRWTSCAAGPTSGRKRAASARLKAVWKFATARPGSGSSAVSSGSDEPDEGQHQQAADQPEA